MRVFGDPFSNRFGKTMGRSNAIPFRYLVDDKFVSIDAAPLTSPRTCEPGPGQLVIIDTNNTLGIPAGGEIVPVAMNAGNNNPGIYHNAGFSRVAGRTFKTRVKNVSAFGSDANKTFSPLIGWMETAGEANIANMEGVCFWIANTKFQVFDSISAVNVVTLKTNAADTYYDIAVILRSGGGAFHVVDGELLFITQRSTDSNVHPNIATIGSNRNNFGAKYFINGDLPYPWNTDYGIATQRLSGARAVNDTYTHEANGYLEFTITTLPAAGTIQVSARRQDNNNMIRIDIASTGNLTVQEVIAGTPNARLSIASCLAGDRIVLMLNGAQSNVCRDRSSGITQTTAYNVMGFATQTSGKVESLGTGGAISDLVTWPYQLSGTALLELSRL